MYDPARANADSHRTSPARTYIMNVLGVQKEGFWVDMPNRFMAKSGPTAYRPWEDQALKYNPQVTPYVQKQWNLDEDDSEPSKPMKPLKMPQPTAGGMQAPEPHTLQPIQLNTGHGFLDVLEGGKKTPTGISTAEFTAGGVIQTKDFIKDAKLENVTKKPKPKPQQKQGLTQKATLPSVTNRNYYQPQPYQSQVKSLNSRGY